jgi:hypothetical protein
MFDRIDFENIHEDALIWIEKPNKRWAAADPQTTPDNCGNWPCTAPNNILLKFSNTDGD